MKMSRKNIFLSVISIILVILLIWFSAALYLVSQSTKLIYAVEKSKNLSYDFPNRSEFLTLKSGEKIEVMVAEAENLELKNNIIVYFHGNWGRIPANIQQLTKFGTVVSPAYPGYSNSAGTSNSKKVYETAKVTLDWLDSQGVLPSDITIFGHSLGGSAAIYAAANYPNAKRLVLVNTFYSVQKQCQLQYGLLCVLSEPIHNNAKISAEINPEMPLYHFHNQNDELIPQSQGKDLFELMPNRNKKFSDISGTHGDIDANWVMQEVLK